MNRPSILYEEVTSHKKKLYFRFCKQAEFVVKTDDDWVIDLYGTYTVARDISSKKKRDNVNMY